MSVFNEKFHCVLSRLLWDYPKLWRPRGPQFGLFEELAEKVSQEMEEQVSAEKVKSTLRAIRNRLERLDKGLSASMKTDAYLWYARELQYWRAVEVLQNAELMQKKRRLEESPETVGIDLADAAPLKTKAETNDSAQADFGSFKEEVMEPIQEDNDGPSTSATAAHALKKQRRDASPEAVGIDLANAAPSKTKAETNHCAPVDFGSFKEEVMESIQEDSDGPSTSAAAAHAQKTQWRDASPEAIGIDLADAAP
ncbi:uncharacterized protein LOC119644122, partial [Glossina fuscipes]|uniref:Uncharacterized protein LOC119644122 n=1 Tax=Glossina fuscipes TaxID=7396 RepID=A0A9C5ZND5_9MUSC